MTMKERCFRAVCACCLVVIAFVQNARAQQRSLYQQTQNKGQEIGKLTGDVYFARMDAYRDWDFYEQHRPLNVAGMYRALTSNRR
jgi:hypothetical protein